MSKKAKAKVKPKRLPSRWDREARRQIILEIVISLVIVGIVAGGIISAYNQYIKPWHQPIVGVNDTVFDMNYFVKMLRLYGLDSTADASLVESVATTIENNELLRQEAERRSLLSPRPDGSG